jgi:hypothetical protein
MDGNVFESSYEKLYHWDISWINHPMEKSQAFCPRRVRAGLEWICAVQIQIQYNFDEVSYCTKIVWLDVVTGYDLGTMDTEYEEEDNGDGK